MIEMDGPASRTLVLLGFHSQLFPLSYSKKFRPCPVALLILVVLILWLACCSTIICFVVDSIITLGYGYCLMLS